MRLRLAIAVRLALAPAAWAEGPNPEPYEVLSFGPDGVSVFSRHDPR